MTANSQGFSFVAGGAIAEHRFVIGGAADFTAIQATSGPTAPILGVAEIAAAAAGDQTTVCVFGITRVEAGAAITRFARLTSDSTGRAVTAAPGAGVNVGTGGIALESAAAAGELISILVVPSAFQG